MPAPRIGPPEYRIYRVTHRENLSRILSRGLECAALADPGAPYRAIGNEKIIQTRGARSVPVRVGVTPGWYPQPSRRAGA